MKSVLKIISVVSNEDLQIIDITDLVRTAVGESGIVSGTVHIMTHHTTSGITVNEGLTDIEDDLLAMLQRLVPRDGDYRHARFLHSDGAMAVNASSHLRAALIGKDTLFPIHEGNMVMGSRQTIYFVEFDGPAVREVAIHMLGE